MAAKVDVAKVELWGKTIGAVAWDDANHIGSFEYDPKFRGSHVELAPLTMPLGKSVYSFPELSRAAFRGLPGMLADSLPDRFGNLLIDQWLATQGRELSSFSPVERLCYMGTRGMGALEFRPALSMGKGGSLPIHVDALVELASEALSSRGSLNTSLSSNDDALNADVMNEILQVGTSAGGARAKAILAWNPKTGEVRSGQVPAPRGFEYWLLKLDGVAANRDKELANPLGYGKVEYAYYLMATAAGIEMSECRLFHENGRSHFMTKRFDRADDGSKLHMQSLCAMSHLDYNQPGAHSYEQALQTIQRLGLPKSAIVEQFKRMVFNILSRIQDDHTKNIAFLMDKKGHWRLAPAFDVIYSYNPDGAWTARHQMTVNGKRDQFSRSDLVAVARRFSIPRIQMNEVFEQVLGAVKRWPRYARDAGVPASWTKQISKRHRVLVI